MLARGLFLALVLTGCAAAGGSEAGSGGSGSGGTAGNGASAGSGGTGAAAGSGGGAGNGGSAGASGGAGGAPPGYCERAPACDGPLPDLGATRSWRNPVESTVIALAGAANHRGRDLLLAPTDAQWIIGKFAYGLVDKDLKGEEIDVWLERDCAGVWERLGMVLTTEEGAHPTVEGVDDSGGRAYLEIPAAKRLGLGRHRALMVVAGDLTHTEAILEVRSPGTRVAVTDLDGTMTTTETEEFTDLLTGAIPDVNADGPSVITAFRSKGFVPLYLTARPEFLVERTREFLRLHGFPPGIIHTTLTLTGALGSAAVGFKQPELEALQAKGFPVLWAIGNTETDAEAFARAGVGPPEHRIMYRFDDSLWGSRRIDDYATLLPEIDALDADCTP